MNLVISGRDKNTADDKEHSRLEEHEGPRTMLQRHSSPTMTNMKSERILKRKTFIEDSPNYNYKLEELPSCPEMTKRRFPTVLIGGVSKGGTTTLLNFLNVHPRIAARDGKDPINRRTSFFNGNTKKTNEWYRNLMPCSYSNQITTERSPAYFICQKCPDAISKFNAKMKLIFIFRDPITRAFSHYLMDKRTSKLGNKTFEEAVLDANLTQVQETSLYVSVSRYVEHIQRWLRKFSIDQMLFLDSNTFISRPSDVLGSVEKFLGIDRFFTEDMFKVGKRGKYCLMMEEGSLVCPPGYKGLLPPEMKNTTTRILKRYFKPFNRNFSRLINKEFEWGY